MTQDTDAEHTDGDLLEREGEALVEMFNDAAKEYSPELEWFAMSYDREKGQAFVLEAEKYIDPEGLVALREAGRVVRYIEAYEFQGDVGVQIEVPVMGEVP